jgi:Sulfotransferase domain
MNPIINLISGPRNISTALMYSFAQRPEFAVLDEPFYGFYLSNALLSIEHPGQEDIIAQMDKNADSIIAGINALALEKSVFVKGMAHHYLEESPAHILLWKNVILIRHPKKLISSFAKVIESPTLNDIGIKKASELFTYLKDQGQHPIVIDSDELMKNPKRYLQKLCGLLDLNFSEQMMHWKQGGIPEDGLWAKYWYKNVHKTTGFQTQQLEPIQIPNYLGPLLAEAMPYYEILQKAILKND